MGNNLKVDLGVLSGKPFKTGSVQDHFKTEIDGTQYLLCRTTESGSVFDVGTIFTVPGSDIQRTIIRHRIYSMLQDPESWKALDETDIRGCFADDKTVADLLGDDLLEKLRQSGVRTHHVGMVDAKTGEVYRDTFPPNLSNLVLIEAFPVFKPAHFGFLGKFGWDYNEYFKQGRKVVALEHIFRLGVPGGSSLLKRYQVALKAKGIDGAREFLDSVGVAETPKQWKPFKNMVYDPTTKYEPEDRHLAWQETKHLSSVSAAVFEKMVRTLIYCTIITRKFFRNFGFELWDIKWEAAVDGDEIYVIDTIDPDSIRVTSSYDYEGRKVFVHFNKQSIRDYYKIAHPDWCDALDESKKAAHTDAAGRDFMEIYREGVAAERYPDIPEVDGMFSQIVSDKYFLMVRPILDDIPQEDIEYEMSRLMQAEIEFYGEIGKLNKFLEMNAG